MKTLHQLIIAALIFNSMGLLLAQTVDCPQEGRTKLAHIQALNLKKNRSDFPRAADINTAVDFAKLLASKEQPIGFAEGQAATIIGFVSNVKIGALETCNCKQKDHWLRDTHIELTLDPMDEGNKEKLLVVEVTPRFREQMKKQGLDWSQKNLRDAFMGRWVSVTGWIFYDANHDDESAGHGNTNVWRGSAWELHPVTSIQITVRPKSAVPNAVIHATTKPPTDNSNEGRSGSGESVAKQCTALTLKGTRCSRMTTNANSKCWQHSK
ncbi:MAG: hypothetical protein HQ472_04315 [Ignavibacteria bacterium]|nr:hypothetical protein [Ignavibacteria bacterium]